MSNDNFEIAMDLLRCRYGNKKAQIRELHGRLIAMKPCNNSEDCKNFALELEQVVRQLKAQRQEVENPHIYMTLEQKLSRPMLREMLAIKAASTV